MQRGTAFLFTPEQLADLSMLKLHAGWLTEGYVFHCTFNMSNSREYFQTVRLDTSLYQSFTTLLLRLMYCIWVNAKEKMKFSI